MKMRPVPGRIFITLLGAAGPWYPPELRNIARGGTQNSDFVNERREKVVTLDNLTLEQAVQGNASLYAWSKGQLVRDLRAKGIDFASRPKEQQFYWSTVYFNAGPGTGKKLLDRRGLDWSGKKWTGPDFPEHPNARAMFVVENQQDAHFNATWRTSSYEFLMRMCGGAIKSD